MASTKPPLSDGIAAGAAPGKEPKPEMSNRSATVMKSLVMALPVGLVILGALSMVIYLRGEEKKKSAASRPINEIAPMLRKEIDQSALEATIRTLSETLGPRSVATHDVLESAASFLESSLGRMNMGYTVERQTYEVEGKACHNLIAELPGGSRAEEIIVVGAHYDTAGPTPGADDNASGVAVLLAVAHAMTGTRNERTVRFVAFTNEEPPFFQTDQMGSRIYARACVDRGDRILGMLCLESLGYYDEEEGSQTYPEEIDAASAGYPTTGDFVAVVGNPSSSRLVEGFVTGFNEVSRVPAVGASLPSFLPWVNASDHWSFWQEDIQAVMITDTAPLRNPHYHTPGDTLETLDLERLTEVARGVEAVVRRLANPDKNERDK